MSTFEYLELTVITGLSDHDILSFNMISSTVAQPHVTTKVPLQPQKRKKGKNRKKLYHSPLEAKEDTPKSKVYFSRDTIS